MKQGSIAQCFIRFIIKLLRKDKFDEDGISNFHPLTILNADFKILAKILEDCLQTVQPPLIGPEQDSLYMIRMKIENVNSGAMLIKLDQSKTFNSVDHGFLEAVLSAAGFELHFRSRIHFLYVSPGVIVEVNKVRSKPFTLSRSISQGCPTQVEDERGHRDLKLPSASVVARYTAYADDISVLVTSSADVVEVIKENITKRDSVSLLWFISCRAVSCVSSNQNLLRFPFLSYALVISSSSSSLLLLQLRIFFHQR